MIRTFVDAGVFIAAARGTGTGAERALQVLRELNREFASSLFLKLEVPLAICPSVLQAIDQTRLACLYKVFRHSPVLTLHSFSVQSALPLTRI